MTLNEIAYNIKNLAEGGYTTDDNKISIRQIKAWIHYHRMSLLETYSDNGKSIPKGATQDLGNFSVPDEGVALTLPKLASFGSSRAITSITSVDGNMLFARTSRDKISIQEESRFTSAMAKFYVENGNTLYFHGSGGGELVKIIGVLEDPTELSSWVSDDSTYPIPTQLINPLIRSVAEVELQLTIQSPSDLINNEIESDKEFQTGRQ